MNDARVAEAVLGLFRAVNCLVDALAAYERHEGHHLLDGHERIVKIRFAE